MNIKGILLIFLFALLFLNPVHAFAVAAPYWGDNPLYVSPGENTEVALSLQNMAGEPEDLTVNVELTNGEEITTITSSESINLPFGADNVPVTLAIRIPETAQPNEKWTITVSFETITTEKQVGVITLNTGVEKSFDVIVRSEESTSNAPEETTNLLQTLQENKILIIILLVALGIILLFLLWRNYAKK